MLDLTVHQASEILSNVPALSELQALREVGLGYPGSAKQLKPSPAAKLNGSSSRASLRGNPLADHSISWMSPPQVSISTMSSN